MSLDYPFTDLPPTGQRFQVADGVYWLRFPLPFALDHINLWLLEDNHGWTLVDTGLGVRRSRKIWQQLLTEQLDGKPLQRIVVTHHHPDHLGMAGWLQEQTGAAMFTSRGEWDLVQSICQTPDTETRSSYHAFLSSHGLFGDTLDRAVGNGNGFRRVLQPLAHSPGFLGAGDTLTVNGDTWHIYIGRGHAPEHLCLYRPRDQVLISGDQVLPTISSNLMVSPLLPEDDPVTGFVDSLTAIRDALPEKTLVLPAHGLPFFGLHQRINELVAHHDSQLAKVLDACQSGPVNAHDLLPMMFRRELDGQQMMFAMGESLAHLNCLWKQGKIHRQQQQGVCYFVA